MEKLGKREPLCGILEFMSSMPFIAHEIKYRFTDFVVNEIDESGKVAPTQSAHYEHVKKQVVKQEFVPIQLSTECEIKLTALLGDKITSDLKAFIAKINQDVNKSIPFIVEASLTKPQRTEFHAIIRNHLSEFESSTQDDDQKKLLIALKSTLTKNKRKELNFAPRNKTVYS